MKIAVACDGLETSSYALHCESFMCYGIDRGVISQCNNLPNPCQQAEELAALLSELSIDVIIAKGIDLDTGNACCAHGIEVIPGQGGTAREAVEAYLSHTLIGHEDMCAEH